MTYEGLTVLTVDPNRRDEVNQAINRKKTRVDSGTGPFTDISKSAAARPVRSFNWFMPNRTAINDFRSFMAERAGQVVPFWLPTWHHDLQLTADVITPNTTLQVLNIGYARYQFDSVQTWRRHLAFIKLGLGIQFIIRIDGANEVGTNENLTLTVAPSSPMVKGQWMLSFLTLCRLETDDYTLNWHSKNAAECSFDVREIPQETTPVPV